MLQDRVRADTYIDGRGEEAHEVGGCWLRRLQGSDDCPDVHDQILTMVI